MQAKLFLTTMLLLLSSCANLNVNRNDTPQSGGQVAEVRLASFLAGVVPGRPMPPLESICPKGRIESIAFGMTGGDVGLTLVTLGVYVPHRAVVTCGK